MYSDNHIHKPEVKLTHIKNTYQAKAPQASSEDRCLCVCAANRTAALVRAPVCWDWRPAAGKHAAMRPRHQGPTVWCEKQNIEKHKAMNCVSCACVCTCCACTYAMCVCMSWCACTYTYVRVYVMVCLYLCLCVWECARVLVQLIVLSCGYPPVCDNVCICACAMILSATTFAAATRTTCERNASAVGMTCASNSATRLQYAPVASIAPEKTRFSSCLPNAWQNTREQMR